MDLLWFLKIKSVELAAFLPTGAKRDHDTHFSSDNGPARYDASQFVRYVGPGSAHLDYWVLAAHEGGTRVIFIMEYPQLVKQNRQISILASNYGCSIYTRQSIRWNISCSISCVQGGCWKLHDKKRFPILTFTLLATTYRYSKLYNDIEFHLYGFNETLNKLISVAEEGDSNVDSELHSEISNSYENCRQLVCEVPVQ